MNAAILEAQQTKEINKETPAPLNAPKDTLKDDIFRQFKEEVGPEPIATAKDLMLRQKYGIIPLQPEHTETNWIKRLNQTEGRNGIKTS